tara:strand:+ start:445 stop:3711 length:3267 start_codon:yes stop_codon:yes gene_type:complete
MINFAEPYNKENFISFLEVFLPDDFVQENTKIEIEENHKSFKEARILGSVNSLDKVIIIEIKRIRAEKSRANITKQLFKFLENLGYSKALIITFSDNENHYRFSYVKSNLEWVSETKVKRKFSNPKRLSFLLGKNQKIHTALKQFIKLGKIKDLEDLNSRFDIEVVNKEFFENYISLYNQLFIYLNKDKKFKSFTSKNKIKIDVFAKKLLGQIVFCYFLQKKGWLGAKENENINQGDLNFIRNQFIHYNKKKNFFNDCLEPLFYKGLNKQNKNNFCNDLKCKIPYLNGGLFQEIENYSWKESYLNIPNKLFSNIEANGILDIFDLYNFTVDETADFDVEIAVDPEMLGYIFENLLPENLRKKHGAHYTPKEIVEYICKKSLSEYLMTNIDKKYLKEINNLIGYSRFPDETIRLAENKTINLDFNKEFLLEIDLLLENIKICDPAVGSGAFILGILNFIVNIKKITFYFSKNRILKNLYEVKRNLIENNLFGIDIDYGAIETCKLRLWLSLTIDEDDIVKPLPNLDFRIIQGNSLIEEFDGINLDIVLETGSQQELFISSDEKNLNIQELYKLQKTFFNETDLETKQKIIKKINKLYYSIIKNEIENKISVNFEKKKKLLSNLNNFESVNLENNFMPWQLRFFDVFLEKKGFDIILANPPYNREKDFAEMFKPVNKSNFGQKYHSGKMNFWYYFLHKAIDKTNDNAIISFITSRYWLASSGAKSLIKRIKENLFFIDVLDIGKVKIFDNVIGQHIITTYSKRKIENFTYKKISSNTNDIFASKNTDNLEIEFFNQNEIYKNNQINFEKNIISYDNKYEILINLFLTSTGIQESPDKINKKQLIKLPNKNINIGDGVFVLRDDEIKKLNLKKDERNVLKKYLELSDVKKYKINYSKNCIIYTSIDVIKKIKKKEYINLKLHLDKFKKYITSSNAPYGLHRPRNENYFIEPKIIFKCMFLKPDFTFDDSGFYLGFSFISIIQKSSLDLKYLLALLNSKYGFYWFIKNAKLRGVGFDVTNDMLRNFPIPKINNENKNQIQKIIKMVNKILKENPDDKSLNQIDEIIFKICKFNDKQIIEINNTIKRFLDNYE